MTAKYIVMGEPRYDREPQLMLRCPACSWIQFTAVTSRGNERECNRCGTISLIPPRDIPTGIEGNKSDAEENANDEGSSTDGSSVKGDDIEPVQT